MCINLSHDCKAISTVFKGTGKINLGPTNSYF